MSATAASVFFFWDEEPTLDLTDLSLVQTFMLAAAIVAAALDGVEGASLGHYAPADRTLAAAAA
jgi:hypothetical protein